MFENYIITKFKGKYRLFDVFAIEMEDFIRNTYNNDRIVIDKYNRVYYKYEYKVIDDWYFDIGQVSHFEKEQVYLGKLIYKSNDIEDIAKRFVELINGGVK